MRLARARNFQRQLRNATFYGFAGITGDFNPLHTNEEKAGGMYFGKRIVHGMLTASFLSTVIAGSMPGPGTIYMEQDAKFLRPVFSGILLPPG